MDTKLSYSQEGHIMKAVEKAYDLYNPNTMTREHFVNFVQFFMYVQRKNI